MIDKEYKEDSTLADIREDISRRLSGDLPW